MDLGDTVLALNAWNVRHVNPWVSARNGVCIQ